MNFSVFHKVSGIEKFFGQDKAEGGWREGVSHYPLKKLCLIVPKKFLEGTV